MSEFENQARAVSNGGLQPRRPGKVLKTFPRTMTEGAPKRPSNSGGEGSNSRPTRT